MGRVVLELEIDAFECGVGLVGLNDVVHNVIINIKEESLSVLVFLFL